MRNLLQELQSAPDGYEYTVRQLAGREQTWYGWCGWLALSPQGMASLEKGETRFVNIFLSTKRRSSSPERVIPGS